MFRSIIQAPRLARASDRIEMRRSTSCFDACSHVRVGNTPTHPQLSMSSSSLSAMRKPVLLLNLTLAHADGSTTPHVVELSKDQLDRLLESFAAAAEAVDQFSDLVAYRRAGPDGGQSDAIIEGWDNLSGDILGWLNADDALYPGALACTRLGCNSWPVSRPAGRTR